MADEKQQTNEVNTDPAEAAGGDRGGCRPRPSSRSSRTQPQARAVRVAAGRRPWRPWRRRSRRWPRPS